MIQELRFRHANAVVANQQASSVNKEVGSDTVGVGVMSVFEYLTYGG